MKLILAVSGDGFLCRGPEDDMKWTGPLDKFIFKLLTLSDGATLLAGSTTFSQLPILPGRKVVRISRGQYPGALSLPMAQQAYPDGWLLGGPTVARAALEQGLVSKAYICRSPNRLMHGIHLDSLEHLLPSKHCHKLCFQGTEIEVFTEKAQWPGK